MFPVFATAKRQPCAFRLCDEITIGKPWGREMVRVLSCKCLHNDFIQNIFLFHSRDRRYYAEKARGAALKIENGVICC